MFGCALEMAGLRGFYAVCCCEGFGGVAPHLKAAVAAFAILAFEGGVSVSLNESGHVGLLYE